MTVWCSYNPRPFRRRIPGSRNISRRELLIGADTFTAGVAHGDHGPATKLENVSYARSLSTEHAMKEEILLAYALNDDQLDLPIK